MSKTTDKLLALQADAHALWLRFHNYHWNVKGLQFYAIHEMTEKAYEAMARLFDELAERALQLGAKAHTCPKALVDAANVPKCTLKDKFSANDVLEALKADYSYLLKEFKALDKVAENDIATQNLAQDKIAELEKALWMLENALDKSCTKK